ncbi:hypothetical protein GW758_04085 [Candidatus Falkowbacteria bacterium]|nr:hypothetical protein [Candidatus Falkowbacteria bacterium]
MANKKKVLIKDIIALEILNSSGRSTLEIKIIGDNNQRASASYAFDNYETLFSDKDKLDNDEKRYKGWGRLNSIELVNKKIKPELLGHNIFEQVELDEKLKELNGPERNNLGPALIYCISLACANLAASSLNQELFLYITRLYNLRAINKNTLPLPIFNIFNGGDTGDTDLDFQEFLLIPKRATVNEMIRKSSEVFLELAEVLKEAGLDTDTGQEGGYAPEMDSSIEALEFIITAILRRGYNPGEDFDLGLDIGSSILYDTETKKYIFSLDGNYFSALDLTSLYEEWLSRYPIIYLEDAYSENDWESWHKLNTRLGKDLAISADDLLASNIKRLRQSLDKKALNTVVLKPAKAGTLTESVLYAKLAQDHDYKLVVSGLNQETNDKFIADLAVSLGADYFKAGSLARGERTIKYNRLLEIESEL